MRRRNRRRLTLWCKEEKVFTGPPCGWDDPDRETHYDGRLIHDEYEVKLHLRREDYVVVARTECTEPWAWGFWMRTALLEGDRPMVHQAQSHSSSFARASTQASATAADRNGASRRALLGYRSEGIAHKEDRHDRCSRATRFEPLRSPRDV